MTLWQRLPRREFVHVDDCADALVFLMQNYSGEEHVNIGAGMDTDIASLARLVQRIIGCDGALEHDLQSRMALQANLCPTPSSPRWAGRRASRWKMACGGLTRIG
jgi:nucleoside-diphosphate-sugar epimerase